VSVRMKSEIITARPGKLMEEARYAI